MEACYEDRSFEKKKSMKKGDLYFSSKNTSILITTHCMLTFVVSPRKQSLMDLNFSSKMLSPARLLLFKNAKFLETASLTLFYSAF
jgi:hypothetical protein